MTETEFVKALHVKYVKNIELQRWTETQGMLDQNKSVVYLYLFSLSF